MAIVYNNVLVPVDFSINTGLAIKKCLALTGTAMTALHLLHVVNIRNTSDEPAAKDQLDNLRRSILESHPGLFVNTHVLNGHFVQKTITGFANMLTPDLIVIGKQNQRRKKNLFPTRLFGFPGEVSPDRLARKTNCPVLTVKPGSDNGRIRIIVLPVWNFLPERKIEWALLLARKFRAQVHLLAVQRKQHNEGLSQIFLKAYHTLRENLHHPIEFATIAGNDSGRETLMYAEQVMADMILVNPYTESSVHSLIGSRHISDLLERNSKIQILDIQPYGSEVKSDNVKVLKQLNLNGQL